MCRINLYIGTQRIAPVFLAAALVGCDAPPTATAPDAGASPNASILPAPLATESPDLFDAGPSADDGTRSAAGDATNRPAPEPLRPATPLAPEWPAQRDATGVTLDAVFRSRDLPPPPRGPEVSSDAHRDAQKATTLAVKVDLGEAGRMRVELVGSAFLLPPHTEIRARADHYGNLLVWPNAGGYRVVPPGALRPVLGERRLDTMPLSVGSAPRAQGEARRLGLLVRKVEVSSAISVVRLELGRMPESGDGGALLCRALVELGGVDPRTPVCQAGEVPLSASYAWLEGGGITFEVTSVAKRTDLPASALLVPPAGVPLVASGLPAVPNGIFLSREALASLRTAPLPLPTPRDPQVPGEGFVAANQGDRLMVLSLDGVPTLWVPPLGEQYVVGPLRGRYLVQWRTFLGEKVGAPQLVEVPGRLTYGMPPDGGAPDGGGP
jgi:hypothetical protein